MIAHLKERLLDYPLVYRLYHRKNEWQKERRFARRQMDMVYKLEDLTQEYYEKIKTAGERELEHQIGRLTNWRRILADCAKLEGQFIEFGTYRGFSLLWLAYFLERLAMYDRMLIGVDSFSGLPYADGSFRRGSFGDNSLQLCRRDVLGHRRLYDRTKKNIIIEQCFFNEHERIHKIMRQSEALKFCFIHIDCDVAQSFSEIFMLLIKYDLIAPKAYILFDDYGLDTNLARTVQERFEEVKGSWEIQTDSTTRFTHNFMFSKKCEQR